MGKTFLQEFEDAVKRLGTYKDQEQDRIHREAMRDPNHAFKNVDIQKPNPWRHGGGLTL